MLETSNQFIHITYNDIKITLEYNLLGIYAQLKSLSASKLFSLWDWIIVKCMRNTQDQLLPFRNSISKYLKRQFDKFINNTGRKSY